MKSKKRAQLNGKGDMINSKSKPNCPATQHCIKKLLAAGQRGKGTKLDDLKGAMAALNRAIDLAERED